MAGNSQRRGAMRKSGTKKGMTVGSGGQKRRRLEGKGPTPKATERPYHAAAKRKKAAEKRAASPRGTTRVAGSRASSAKKSRTSTYLFGRNPVVEALRAKVPATTLYVQSKADADDRWREALQLAVAQDIPLLEAPRTEMDALADGGAHQGLLLVVPEYTYADIDDLATTNLLIVLDGVTDPRNLGAIARSAAAFGAGGIIVPSRRSVGVNAAAWKTSAGAFTRVPVAQVTNLTRTITQLQDEGFIAVALDARADVTLAAMKKDVWTDRVIVVIGSEGKGVSRLVSETCDWRLSIPMVAKQESLNASVAAGIVLQRIFEARS